MATWQEYLQRGANAVEGYFDWQDVPSDQSAPDASVREASFGGGQYAEKIAPDNTDFSDGRRAMSAIPSWAYLALGAGVLFVAWQAVR